MKSVYMQGRLGKLVRLSWFEWKLLMHALLLIPAVSLSLRMQGYRRTEKWLRGFLPESGATSREDTRRDKAYAITRIVRITAAHGPLPANCLNRSLVLWWLLARHGIRTKIIFGVGKNSTATLHPHAWVEYEGYNLLEPHDENYIALS